VVSYPDATQAPDGTIHASWDRDRTTLGEILMARFREDDVLAGRSPVVTRIRANR
jgi:hypothetical protein